jgi:hypothetical protein
MLPATSAVNVRRLIMTGLDESLRIADTRRLAFTELPILIGALEA